MKTEAHPSQRQSLRERRPPFQRNGRDPQVAESADLRPFQPVLLASLRNQLSAHESQAALTALARAVCDSPRTGRPGI